MALNITSCRRSSPAFPRTRALLQHQSPLGIPWRAVGSDAGPDRKAIPKLETERDTEAVLGTQRSHNAKQPLGTPQWVVQWLWHKVSVMWSRGADLSATDLCHATTINGTPQAGDRSRASSGFVHKVMVVDTETNGAACIYTVLVERCLLWETAANRSLKVPA